MSRARRVIVHCTGCDETWETRPDVLGARCGAGEVRPATQAEAEEYCGLAAEWGPIIGSSLDHRAAQ